MTGLPAKTLQLQKLPKSGTRIKYDASDDVLAELTPEIGVVACTRLDFNIVAKHWRQNGAMLTGTVKASVVQECVVTLERIENEINVEIVRQFTASDDKIFDKQKIEDGALLLDPEADDLPDVLENNTIDLWEVVVEELNLNIDPYPKKENLATKTAVDTEYDEKDEKPFAALQALLDEKDGSKH